MKGATLPGRIGSIHRDDFNPRTHEGGDSDIVVVIYIDGISIHAPMKGATLRHFGIG